MIGIFHCFAVTFLILQLLFHLEPIHATNGETFLRLLYGSSKKAIEVSPESWKNLFIFIFGRKKKRIERIKITKKSVIADINVIIIPINARHLHRRNVLRMYATRIPIDELMLRYAVREERYPVSLQ